MLPLGPYLQAQSPVRRIAPKTSSSMTTCCWQLVSTHAAPKCPERPRQSCITPQWLKGKRIHSTSCSSIKKGLILLGIMHSPPTYFLGASFNCSTSTIVSSILACCDTCQRCSQKKEGYHFLSHKTVKAEMPCDPPSDQTDSKSVLRLRVLGSISSKNQRQKYFHVRKHENDFFSLFFELI